MVRFMLQRQDITAEDFSVIYSYINRRPRKFTTAEAELCRTKITLPSLLHTQEIVNRALSRIRLS